MLSETVPVFRSGCRARAFCRQEGSTRTSPAEWSAGVRGRCLSAKAMATSHLSEGGFKLCGRALRLNSKQGVWALVRTERTLVQPRTLCYCWVSRYQLRPPVQNVHSHTSI